MLTTNPLQLFILANMAIDKHYPTEKLSALQKSDLAKSNLIQYLAERGIIDLKLVPNHDMTTVLVHLVKSRLDQTEGAIDMTLLKQLLCDSLLDLKTRRSLERTGDCRTFSVKEANLIGEKRSGDTRNYTINIMTYIIDI